MDTEKRSIDVLLFHGVNLLDIAGPVQAFKEATIHGKPAYRIRFIAFSSAPSPTPTNPGKNTATSDSGENPCCCVMKVQTSCGLTLCADTVNGSLSANADLLIPGGEGVDALIGNEALRELISEKHAASNGARLISICSGALLLADAKVLDNRLATTHWARESQVLKQYASVRWKMNQIIVRDENIYTSAGVTTGIDLALSIISGDCGSRAALAVARELVVSLKRSGGQNQFAQIIEWQFSADDSIADLVSAVIEHPERNWSLELMASQASTTPRTLNRKFSASFNTSPMQFVGQVRMRIAGDLLSTGMPVHKVAERAGFGDVQTLRRTCKRQLNTTLGDFLQKFLDTTNHNHTR